jgi:integrase
LLLGQRGDEIVSMEWREVDLEAAVWELPGARTKNGRPHAVPLAPSAHALLARRKAIAGADETRVFPGLSLTTDDHRRSRRSTAAPMSGSI